LLELHDQVASLQQDFTVRDDEDRSLASKRCERLDDFQFRPSIECTGALVENQYGGIPIQGPGKPDSLALPAAQSNWVVLGVRRSAPQADLRKFMGKSVKRNLIATEPGPVRWPDLIQGALIVLWCSIAGVAFASELLFPSTRDSADGVVARCDRLAQVVSNRTSSGPGDARSSQRRRERESALATCLEDPDGFAHSQGVR
jgi:hypothetical protein